MALEGKVEIIWRRRNSDASVRISQPCICRNRPSGRTLRCSACALKAAVTEHLKAGRSPSTPIFAHLHKTQAAERLAVWCRAAGVSGVTWHAFRRGAASDIIAGGGTVSFLMHSGGWRSSAVLAYIMRQELGDCRTLELAHDSDSEPERA